MKISHRQLRLILRIIFILGAIFGLIGFIYDLATQSSILYLICYACYLIVTGGVLYLLFARKRPTSRIAYGIFYTMCFVTVLYSLSYIIGLATMYSRMKSELIKYIEQDKDIDSVIKNLIRSSKCCLIDDDKHTSENFRIFQLKYPDTCGTIGFNEAKSCLPALRERRNVTIIMYCITIILRVLILILLWKYIKDEYSILNDESTNIENENGARSTATFTA